MDLKNLKAILAMAGAGMVLIAGCGSSPTHNGGQVNSSRHGDTSTRTSKTGTSNSAKKPTSSGMKKNTAKPGITSPKSPSTNDAKTSHHKNAAKKSVKKSTARQGGAKNSQRSRVNASRNQNNGATTKKTGATKTNNTGMLGSMHSTNNSPSSQGTSKSPANSSTVKAGANAVQKPIDLSTLPEYTALKPFNHALKFYHEVSNFIPAMGYHWAPPTPGLVLMTNNFGQVTGIETAYPEKLGSFAWNDPPTTEPNGGIAFNSEHLYFVPPSNITTRMSSTMPSSLTSWSRFMAANSRLSSYAKESNTYKGYSIYAPTTTGPAIKVLVSSKGMVSGFMASEPASWGWFRGYTDPKWKPVTSKLYGKAYLSVIWLTPPGAK